MNNPEQQIATYVLVIGTGGSGLRAAIELAERGVGVLVVGKRPKTDAHTTLATGGKANLVWSGPGRIERESIPGIPLDISAQMREVSAHGKLVE
jgi:glycine/D-amino acid oxidase-like deaminating enzyme